MVCSLRPAFVGDFLPGHLWWHRSSRRSTCREQIDVFGLSCSSLEHSYAMWKQPAASKGLPESAEVATITIPLTPSKQKCLGLQCEFIQHWASVLFGGHGIHHGSLWDSGHFWISSWMTHIINAADVPKKQRNHQSQLYVPYFRHMFSAMAVLAWTVTPKAMLLKLHSISSWYILVPHPARRAYWRYLYLSRLVCQQDPNGSESWSIR